MGKNPVIQEDNLLLVSGYDKNKHKENILFYDGNNWNIEDVLRDNNNYPYPNTYKKITGIQNSYVNLSNRYKFPAYAIGSDYTIISKYFGEVSSKNQRNWYVMIAVLILVSLGGVVFWRKSKKKKP